MQSENYIWKLFARCLNGEASPEEIGRFHELLNADESLQQRYEILKQFWSASHIESTDPLEAPPHTEQIARILKKAHEADGSQYSETRAGKTLRRRRIIRILAAGSVLLGVLSVVYFVRNKGENEKITSRPQPEKLQQVVAQKGSRNKTVLPDGSVVWLNAGSYLSYEGKFTGTKREVSLNGEAFFDVVKQPNRPFIVHTNGIDIEVLGTSFDVKSYAEEKKVEATLIRGLIQITQPGRKSQKPVYLHPNEKLVIDLNGDELLRKNAVQNVAEVLPVFTLHHLDSTVKTEARTETAWIYDRLQFNGDNFEELARKLERWYNVSIMFEDEGVKQLSFKGSFENETVEQAFAALQTAASFDYTINEREIFIRSAKKEMP